MHGSSAIGKGEHEQKEDAHKFEACNGIVQLFSLIGSIKCALVVSVVVSLTATYQTARAAPVSHKCQQKFINFPPLPSLIKKK